MSEPLDTALSDAELARRIGSVHLRDAAERELCTRFAPRIRSYGLRHLASASDADDLVQRVLLLVLTKLRAGQVREIDSIASFVLGSARLTAQSMRRGQTRGELLAGDDAGLPEPTVAASEPLDRERLASCFERLGERERNVILSSFFEGASAGEIATALGMEAGHVRVVRHRALASLRACLDVEGGAA